MSFVNVTGWLFAAFPAGAPCPADIATGSVRATSVPKPSDAARVQRGFRVMALSPLFDLFDLACPATTPHFTTTVTSSAVERPPSWARHRSTYVPGSLKVARTAHLPSAGNGGGSQPSEYGEFLPSR